MQRLISLKLASKFTTKTLSDSTAISRTFTSLTKTHSFSHPWLPRGNTLSPRVHGVVSNPVLAKTFLSYSPNALFAKVAFRGLQYPKRSFDHSSSFLSSLHEWRSRLRNLSPDNLVLGLIVANVAVLFAWRVADRRFMLNNFTVSVENFKRGRVHTLITAAFSHIDISHIIHNMIGLYFFGTHLSQVFGSEFLLKLYLAGGIAGSVFYLVHSAYLASSLKDQMWNNPSRRPGLGASGAVNAIILLDIFLHPRSTLLFNFFIPVPAVLLGIYLIGKDVLDMIEGDAPGSAHLGGAAVAALAWVRLRRGRF